MDYGNFLWGSVALPGYLLYQGMGSGETHSAMETWFAHKSLQGQTRYDLGDNQLKTFHDFYISQLEHIGAKKGLDYHLDAKESGAFLIQPLRRGDLEGKVKTHTEFESPEDMFHTFFDRMVIYCESYEKQFKAFPEP